MHTQGPPLPAVHAECSSAAERVRTVRIRNRPIPKPATPARIRDQSTTKLSLKRRFALRLPPRHGKNALDALGVL
jgi:hypothetical protein